MSKVRLISSLEENNKRETLSSEESPSSQVAKVCIPCTTQRVQIKRSPIIEMLYKCHQLATTLDTGSETNMINKSTACLINAPITKSFQKFPEVDGKSELTVIGETRIQLTFSDKTFSLEALVEENLDGDIIADIPFLSEHDIMLRPSKRQVIFKDESSHYYHNDSIHQHPAKVKRTSVHIIQSPATTIWPEEFWKSPSLLNGTSKTLLSNLDLETMAINIFHGHYQ